MPCMRQELQDQLVHVHGVNTLIRAAGYNIYSCLRSESNMYRSFSLYSICHFFYCLLLFLPIDTTTHKMTVYVCMYVIMNVVERKVTVTHVLYFYNGLRDICIFTRLCMYVCV